MTDPLGWRETKTNKQLRRKTTTTKQKGKLAKKRNAFPDIKSLLFGTESNYLLIIFPAFFSYFGFLFVIFVVVVVKFIMVD